MITLHIHTAQQKVLKGSVTLIPGTQVTLTASASTLEVSTAGITDLYNQAAAYFDTNRPLVYINSKTSSDMFLIGDACTSIICTAHPVPPDMSTDPDKDLYKVDAPADNQLYIIDQCPACNDCTDKNTLMQELQKRQIILSAIKDNNLYMPQKALERWNTMIDYIRDSTNCQSSIQMPKKGIANRTALVRAAIRLFGQYKALVQLWNYLVLYRQTDTVLGKVSTGCFGFSVQTHKALNLCAYTSPVVTCTLDIQASQAQSSPANIWLYIHDPKAQVTYSAINQTDEYPVDIQSGNKYACVTAAFAQDMRCLPAQFTLQLCVMSFASYSTAQLQNPIPQAVYRSNAAYNSVINQGQPNNRWQIRISWDVSGQTIAQQTRYIETCPVKYSSSGSTRTTWSIQAATPIINNTAYFGIQMQTGGQGTIKWGQGNYTAHVQSTSQSGVYMTTGGQIYTVGTCKVTVPGGLYLRKSAYS